MAPFRRNKRVWLRRYALHPVWSPLHQLAGKIVTSTLGHINALESATGTLPHIDTYTHNHTHHPQTKWRAREMPIRPDRPLLTSCDVAV